MVKHVWGHQKDTKGTGYKPSKGDAMIPVYENGKIVGQVSYNNNLDFWDGSNYTCGFMGRHKGLTVLKKSGKFVLIHGTQWRGERDTAEVITAERAVSEILESGNHDLFEEFPQLSEIITKGLDPRR